MEISKIISQEEILEIVTKLISMESHKDVEQRESLVADYIRDIFIKEGIEYDYEEVEPKRPNILGKLTGKDSNIHLMFNGHIDTVPGYSMDYDAFKPFIKEGMIYGRGSADMKSAIGAMIAAIVAIKREGLVLDKTVAFAGVIDEEERSKGTEQLIKNGVKPEHVIIGEPTELRVCTAHKGMEWIEVTFKGQATHGSRPHEGKNAVYMASEFSRMIYEELEPEITQRKFELLGNGTINVGFIKGGNDPNIVPDSCVVQIDRRWLPNETLEFIHEEIREYAQIAADKFGGSLQVNGMREFTASMINAPYSIDPNHPFVKETIDITNNVTGKELPVRDFPAWSDAGLLGNHVDSKCIILGPGNINQAHANDEFCSIDEIFKASEIYYKLIKKMCMGGN